MVSKTQVVKFLRKPNASFKSIVFKRSNNTPPTPTGGSYSDPIPNGWTDGVPSGEEKLWMSTRVFSANGESPQQDVWTVPSQITDTADFDVEYSEEDTPQDPYGHPNKNPQWTNTANERTIWMATSKQKNGEWSAWQISKIKGEKGQDGTSIQIKGRVLKHFSTKSEYLAYVNGSSDTSVVYGAYIVDTYDNYKAVYVVGNPAQVSIPAKGDCYTTADTNRLWMSDGDVWVDCGEFKGEKGDKGDKGADGTNGVSITSVVNMYLATYLNSGVTIRTSGWESEVQYPDSVNKYLWNYEIINYSDGSQTTTAPAIIGVYGDKGVGITNVVEYYLTSNAVKGVTHGTSGWSTDIPQISATSKYLWNYEVITYSDGSTELTSPVIIGAYGDKGDKGSDGDKGEKGAVLRIQNWADVSTTFRFESGAEGETYKDVVFYKEQFYSCMLSHGKSDINYPGSNTDKNKGLWQLGEKLEMIATNIFLANYALIKNLGVEAIEMKDSKGNVVFYAKGGNVECNKGTFKNIQVEGSVRNPFILSGSIEDANYNDNVCVVREGDFDITNPFGLIWDVSQSGRRISVLNYKWDDETSSGAIVLSNVGHESMKFYEYGVEKATIRIAYGELIEMLGYGDSGKFLGWIVTSRTRVDNRQCGAPMNALAVGSYSTSTGMSCKTHDGTAVGVIASNGTYTMTMPKQWFSNATDCTIMLTGHGTAAYIKSKGFVISGGGSQIQPLEVMPTDTTDNLIFQVVIQTLSNGSSASTGFDFIITNNKNWV